MGKPAAFKHSLDLHERNCGVGTAEGEAPSHEAKNKKIDERWSLCNAEGERYGGGDSTEGDVESVADVLEDEEESGWDPETAGDEGVDDAVEAEGDEAALRSSRQHEQVSLSVRHY